MNKYLIFILTFFLQNSLLAQPIYVGQPVFGDLSRIAQLQGKLNTNYSLSVMQVIPVDSLTSLFEPALAGEKPHRSSITLHLTPFTFQSKFNSHHPYGWNDAGMIMAKGLQTQLSGGFYAKIGPLTIQLRPELVWAANSNYDTSVYYGTRPNQSFSKLYPGQSSIFLNWVGMGLGISTENLWWGPGQFSSLLMSNNAPGFPHIRFQSNRPLKTPIGSFEWQLIAARLSEDTTTSFESAYLHQSRPKNDWRYLNGFVISWQPSFLKHFYIGATASQQLYGSELKQSGGGFLKKYLPVFSPPTPTENFAGTSINTDGQLSVFLRSLLPKHKMEWYVEYGYNDYKQNFRDFFMNPSHSAAWIIGMKKIIELSKSKPESRNPHPATRIPQPASRNPYLDLSVELTQMAQTTSSMLRDAGNWYTHSALRQGLTNEGQIIGAGSGLGNNVQTLQVRKFSGLDMWGIKLQRIQQDPKDIYYGPVSSFGMREYAWTDIALGILGQKRWNKIIAGGEMQLVSSKNYAWKQGNAFNLFFTTHISYFF